MSETLRRWARKHEAGLAVGAGILGTGYLAARYLVTQLTETTHTAASERACRESLRRRFHQNQDDCTLTVLELIPSMAVKIIAELPSEEITQELMRRRKITTNPAAMSTSSVTSAFSSTTMGDDYSSPMARSSIEHELPDTGMSQPGRPEWSAKSKTQLWNDLKLTSITRAFTLIYVICLTNILTRIQLNLLGRKTYVSSIIEQVSPARDQGISLKDNLDDSTQDVNTGESAASRRFLALSWWLLNHSWQDLMQRVNEAVTSVFGSIEPNSYVSLSQLSIHILDVRKLVEGQTDDIRRSRSWLSELLPSHDMEEYVLAKSGLRNSESSRSFSDIPKDDMYFRSLVQETSDLIESPTFTQVLTLLLDAGFSILADHKLRVESYKLQPLNEKSEHGSESLRVESDAKAIKLAISLATITREAHKIGRGIPNDYMQAMDNVPALEAFAALIFSNKFDSSST